MKTNHFWKVVDPLLYGKYQRTYYAQTDNLNNLICSQLCVLLNAETIFRTFAEILQSDVTSIRFASVLVRVLHTILITSAELFELRTQLKDIQNEVCSCVVFKHKERGFSSFYASEIRIAFPVPVPMLGALPSFDIVTLFAGTMLPACIRTRYYIVSGMFYGIETCLIDSIAGFGL